MCECVRRERGRESMLFVRVCCHFLSFSWHKRCMYKDFLPVTVQTSGKVNVCRVSAAPHWRVRG